MAKIDYMPLVDEQKAALFERFRESIGRYAAELGLSAEQIASQAADSRYFRYILNHARTMEKIGTQWLMYKTNLLKGTDPQDGKPVTPQEPADPPAPVKPGVLKRFRALVRQIKAAPKYDESIGRGLGLIGPEATVRDNATLAPDINARLISGRVEVEWNKGTQEAVEIQVDRGDGVFTLLAIDTHPNYMDTAPLPETPARWRYRASYVRDAKRIGNWSSVSQILVGA